MTAMNVRPDASPRLQPRLSSSGQVRRGLLFEGLKMTPITQEEKERFLAFTASSKNGCTLWTGCTLGGYGYFRFREKVWRAHRFAYLLAHGELDKDLVIHHACFQKRCVNPEHLEQVTAAENKRRRTRRRGERTWEILEELESLRTRVAQLELLVTDDNGYVTDRGELRNLSLTGREVPRNPNTPETKEKTGNAFFDGVSQ